MDLISQRLDIFNIFEKMYKYEQKNEPLVNRIIPMSYECRRNIRDLVKSLPIIILTVKIYKKKYNSYIFIFIYF